MPAIRSGAASIQSLQHNTAVISAKILATVHMRALNNSSRSKNTDKGLGLGSLVRTTPHMGLQ